MMPEIVPNRPMNGADVAIVARMLRPFFSSWLKIDAARSQPRWAVSICSSNAQVGFLALQEFGDAGRGHAGQMAALVFLLGGKSQGFLDLSVLQHVGELRGDFFGFRLCPAEGQRSLDEQ